MKLLSIEKDSKTKKGRTSGRSRLPVRTAIQYLAPAKLGSVGKPVNLCPHASKGCLAACLFTAGHAGIFQSVNQARKKRTHLFHQDKVAYREQLRKELNNHVKYCQKNKLKPACRLNGTSDINWQKEWPEIFMEFPTVQFYDYTKHFAKMMDFCLGLLPANYHLTFSKSEDNWEKCETVLRSSGNVAVVFKEIPAEYQGFRVVNGEVDDLRFLDDDGVIVGLKAKGKARKDVSGFVIQ